MSTQGIPSAEEVVERRIQGCQGDGALDMDLSSPDNDIGQETSVDACIVGHSCSLVLGVEWMNDIECLDHKSPPVTVS